ncbi:hypothetical protein U1839_00815 [Sphingomonas sp. RT2P30]|uniref:hypothetical protein n=1 Tax=Parasphingomonas halimpatiens TaxID=3096162 RepID=UPI002FCC65E1
MEQNAPQSDTVDDTAQAFEALRQEVSLARSAVAGLTAARENVPDYSLTLAEISDSLKAASAAINRIEKSPVARLSPVSFAAEINKAASDARAEDRAILQQYRDTMSNSIGRLDGLVKRGQTTDQQLRRVIWSGAGSFAAGILLWSILPGAVARSLPASWHVPEWMAARTMGMDAQHAAARLVEISRTSPGANESATSGTIDEHADRDRRERR